MLTKRILIFLTIFICFGGNIFSGQNVIQKGGQIYYSNYVAVKFKSLPQLSVGLPVVSSGLNNYLTSINTKNTLPFIKENQKEHSGLERIFYIQYDAALDPYYVSSIIKDYAEVEWAEPRFLYNIVYDPNDPSYPSQYSLSKINAKLAWDITKGDTNVVIGIIDTGVDWNHPDLSANIWHNKNEIPDNGIDDDNNGYIDDYIGWDFGGLTGAPDNNPREDRPDHGTHVAGIASAVTNNGIGIASIGFNSKIMPVKTAQDNIRNQAGDALISFGYEGIVYAADNHASIINCSWGGGGFSILSQETINYAISKGALVVCAAGNSGINSSFYPASFNGVISVGASTTSDTKASFSNYGPDVDIMAPGVSILSTWEDPSNIYISNSGTSMASPLAAGLAALIKARFPDYTPAQIGEQLRVNCDNIDSLNPGFQYLIGKGRINAYKSLQNSNSKSVRITDYTFSDEAPGGNGDGILQPGETINLLVKCVNYLSPLNGLTATLVSQNSYSTVINGSFTTAPVSTLQSFDNSTNRFSFKLSESMPANVDINFVVKFSEGTDYDDFQWLKAKGNPDYAVQTGNNVALTITSFGALAFNDYSTNKEGDGFHFKTSNNLIFEAALMTGRSSFQVSDAARGVSGDIQNRDFTKIEPFHFRGNFTDHIEGETVFNDNDAGALKMGISVRLRSYTYTNPLNSNFILLRYTITNNSAAILDNFYSGLFIDWDLVEGSGDGDKTQWDDVSKSGYVYNINQTPPQYFGTALVSPGGDYNFWAILNDGSDGGFNIYDGFSEVEKFQALSYDIGKASAGPGDISHVVSGGPYNINPGESIETAFIIGGGENLTDFQNAVGNARDLYNSIITDVKENNLNPLSFNLMQNYPNPFNPSTKISFGIPKKDHVILKLYDVIGKEIATLINDEKEAGIYTYNFNSGSLSSGVYIYKLQSGNYSASRKLLLLK